MTRMSDAFQTDPTDVDANVFLKKLRHDLLNATRPVVDIPAWIHEDIRDEDIQIPSALRDNLQMLETCGARLSQMIHDLLTFAHVGFHDTTSEIPISVGLDRLSADLHRDFELTQNLTHDALPIPEPDMITLLDALLSNAVKHHDRHGGKIHVSCSKVGKTIRLTIADDGPGIDPTCLQKIFEPLTTLESRDKVEGSGMGLTTARRIASVYGGKIKAISGAEQRGTCIVVWFEHSALKSN